MGIVLDEKEPNLVETFASRYFPVLRYADRPLSLAANPILLLLLVLLLSVFDQNFGLLSPSTVFIVFPTIVLFLFFPLFSFVTGRIEMGHKLASCASCVFSSFRFYIAVVSRLLLRVCLGGVQVAVFQNLPFRDIYIYIHVYIYLCVWAIAPVPVSEYVKTVLTGCSPTFIC